MIFQSADDDDARWAVNMILIVHGLECDARPKSGKGSDTSGIFAQTRERLDRLYRGETDPIAMLSECEAHEFEIQSEERA